MAIRIFGYFNKYPKRGYEINQHPLTIGVEYEKVNMNYSFGNQYAYFNEEITGPVFCTHINLNTYCDLTRYSGRYGASIQH